MSQVRRDRKKTNIPIVSRVLSRWICNANSFEFFQQFFLFCCFSCSVDDELEGFFFGSFLGGDFLAAWRRPHWTEEHWEKESSSSGELIALRNPLAVVERGIGKLQHPIEKKTQVKARFGKKKKQSKWEVDSGGGREGKRRTGGVSVVESGSLYGTFEVHLIKVSKCAANGVEESNLPGLWEVPKVEALITIFPPRESFIKIPSPCRLFPIPCVRVCRGRRPPQDGVSFWVRASKSERKSKEPDPKQTHGKTAKNRIPRPPHHTRRVLAADTSTLACWLATATPTWNWAKSRCVVLVRCRAQRFATSSSAINLRYVLAKPEICCGRGAQTRRGGLESGLWGGWLLGGVEASEVKRVCCALLLFVFAAGLRWGRCVWLHAQFNVRIIGKHYRCVLCRDC